MDVAKLRGKIAEKGITISEVSKLLQIDVSTVHRKLSGGGAGFTLGEANRLVETLDLSLEEAVAIFLPTALH